MWATLARCRSIPLLSTALALVACMPRITHRDFVPAAFGRALEVPGEVGIRGALHVVPADAVDRRSAVLVYCSGADVLEPIDQTGRAPARIRVSFRARNDESLPLTMELGNVLVVIDETTPRPTVLSPSGIVVDEGVSREGDDLLLEPRSIATWQLDFDVPAADDPLGTLRAFLVSWTYRLNGTPYEERTRFVVPGARSDAGHVAQGFVWLSPY